MRQIFLDTETTGLSPEKGHRLVEIAAIAYEKRTPIPSEEGGEFHYYLNPQRSVDVAAEEIHGLDAAFLSTQPLFADIADQLVDFIRGAEIIIHNAEFDRAFIDAEFDRLGYPPMQSVIGNLICSLKWSRQNNQQIQTHSLDALCDHFQVNRTSRSNHSAILDTQLLAQVYFRMSRQQGEMNIPTIPPRATFNGESVRVLRASDAENAEHQRGMEKMHQETGVEPLFSRSSR